MANESGGESTVVLNINTQTNSSFRNANNRQVIDENIRDSTRNKKNRKTVKETNKLQNMKESPIKHRDKGITSSIFNCNPDIVPICVNSKESLSEPLFSNRTFSDLGLHSQLVNCLKNRMNIETATKVQEKAIPLILSGKDALVKSSTGSGKTLSYALPIVQYLQGIEPKISRGDGIYALIIVPARELALQCYDVFSNLTKAFAWIVPGYLMGGEKKKSEKARLRKGVNILISTPGRLLDHMDTTSCLLLNKIEWLVIDEADRLLEEGFENAVCKLIKNLPSERQSVLLSATLTKGVENLSGLSLKNSTIIDIANESGDSPGEFQAFAIPSNLKQYVSVVPAKLRLVSLSGFIADHCTKNEFKGIIFFNSQMVVDFHHALISDVLCSLLSKESIKCKIFKLHGNMAQEDRRTVFESFRLQQKGILFCTDVGARGLDILHVDWIVQYCVPESIEIYVHRVGRTARIGKKGNSLLFMLPSERNFSNLLADNSINCEELPVENFLLPLMIFSDQLQKRDYKQCATALQFSYENTVYADNNLLEIAKEGFRSYIKAYMTYKREMHYVLPFRDLHLGHIAKSFCLREGPSQLGIKQSSPKKKFDLKGRRPPFRREKFPNDNKGRQIAGKDDKLYPRKRGISEFEGLPAFPRHGKRRKLK